MMRYFFTFIVIVSLLAIFSCGDDNGTDVPGEIIILLSPSSEIIDMNDSLELTATVFNTPHREITWYVNDIENGNTDLGAIINNSDTGAVYVAPDTVTTFDSVFVVVVSQYDTTVSDSAKVIFLDPNYVFADPVNGNDNSGTGSRVRPYKTITYSLTQARIGQSVMALAGTYSSGTGETFPLSPPFGISITGVGVDSTIIKAPSGTATTNAAIQARYHQTLIKDVSIVGTDESGVGINFAGISDTTNLYFKNSKIDSCYIAAIKSTRSRAVRFDSVDVSNSAYGFVSQQPGDSLKFYYTTFTDIDSTAIDLIDSIPDVQFLNNQINGALIGINIRKGFALILESAFDNIDSIGVMINDGAYANLGEDVVHGENTFSNCSQWCIYNADNDTIVAKYNTWPVSDSAAIDSLIYDDEESSGSSGPIIFVPFN